MFGDDSLSDLEVIDLIRNKTIDPNIFERPKTALTQELITSNDKIQDILLLRKVEFKSVVGEKIELGVHLSNIHNELTKKKKALQQANADFVKLQSECILQEEDLVKSDSVLFDLRERKSQVSTQIEINQIILQQLTKESHQIKEYNQDIKHYAIIANRTVSKLTADMTAVESVESNFQMNKLNDEIQMKTTELSRTIEAVSTTQNEKNILQSLIEQTNHQIEQLRQDHKKVNRQFKNSLQHLYQRDEKLIEQQKQLNFIISETNIWVSELKQLGVDIRLEEVRVILTFKYAVFYV
jgi:chromosome segregation ATPase